MARISDISFVLLAMLEVLVMGFDKFEVLATGRTLGTIEIESSRLKELSAKMLGASWFLVLHLAKDECVPEKEDTLGGSWRSLWKIFREKFIGLELSKGSSMGDDTEYQ
ncbi:hypothetical protein Tco_0867131 [Tanacetum coccineum]